MLLETPPQPPQAPPQAPPTVHQEIPNQDHQNHLRRIATGHRMVCIAVLLYLGVIASRIGLMIMAEDAPLLVLAFVVLALGTLLYGAISVYTLASAIRSPIIAVIYVVGMLIPLVGLLLLLSLSSTATKTLQANGIKVGLMGANPSAI